MKHSFSWAKCPGFRKTNGQQTDLSENRVGIAFLETKTPEAVRQDSNLSTIWAPTQTQDKCALGFCVLTDACLRDSTSSWHLGSGPRVRPLAGKSITLVPVHPADSSLHTPSRSGLSLLAPLQPGGGSQGAQP